MAGVHAGSDVSPTPGRLGRVGSPNTAASSRPSACIQRTTASARIRPFASAAVSGLARKMKLNCRPASSRAARLHPDGPVARQLEKF